MSFIVAAIGTAVVAVGASVYSADQQRKAFHQQQDAVKAAQAEDARKTAQAEVDTQLAVGTQTAAVKARRRNNALALGDTSGGALGGTSVLGAGSTAPQVAARPAGSALSAGGR